MKVAITGTGFMGTVHCEALKRVRGVEVVGIQGSTKEKSQEAAALLELPKAYSDFAELIADPEVEAVHITTPNRLHFEQASAALNAGKHVMCEKPLAMNATESAELVRLAQEKALAAAVNYNMRFYPLNLEAKQRVLAGKLGDIYSIFGSYQQDWLLYDTDYNWRVLAEEQGELRAVADIGTHWIDLVQNITGKKVEAVFAEVHTVHPIRKRPTGEVETFSGKVEAKESTEPIPVTTDDIGSVMLRFEGGGRGVMFVSQVTSGRKNCLRYEIAGSKASIQWNSEEPNQLWRGARDESNQVILKDPGLNDSLTRRFTDFPGGHAEGFPDTFKMCFRAFYQSIEDKDFGPNQSFATFEDGHREIRLCDAILESHQTQRWVEL
ncbi:MAG: Gfo/Idh/MocA family oxidoreductase [Verrucomicrobiota bacterium]